MLKLESYVSECTADAESHVVWRVVAHGLKLGNLVWCGLITCGVGSGCTWTEAK
jgi:hypothetical protein